MGSRNYTRELRRAQEQGATVVCSMAPHEGWHVRYAPRQKGDPTPWQLKQAPDGPRYGGRECHAVRPDGSWVDSGTRTF